MDAQVLRIHVEDSQGLTVPGGSWELRSGVQILAHGTAGSEGTVTVPVGDPRTGEQTLWVRAIGYRPSSVRIPYLPPTTTVNLVVRLETLAILLPTITVAGNDFTCKSAGTAGLEAGRQIMHKIRQKYTGLRENLDAVALTARGVRQLWRRGIDGRVSVTPEDPTSWVINGSTRSRYLGLIEEQGYAWRSTEGITLGPGGTWRFAPLFWRYPQHFVDSVFIASHCFSLDTGRTTETDGPWMNVYFAPLRSDHTEIAGQLWMDRETHALERVQWFFVGLNGGEAAGGDVRFAEHNVHGATARLLLPVYVDGWWSDGGIVTNTRRWLTEWQLGQDVPGL